MSTATATIKSEGQGNEHAVYDGDMYHEDEEDVV
jgi:hypothetical protein